MVFWVPIWAVVLWMAFPPEREGIATPMELEFARKVADDAELQSSMQTAMRLGGKDAVLAMLRSTVERRDRV